MDFIDCEINKTGRMSPLPWGQGSKKREEKDGGTKYPLQGLRTAVPGRICLLGRRCQEQGFVEAYTFAWERC